MAATAVLATGQGTTHDRLDEAPAWVHKVPEFVCARVDFVSGPAVARPLGGARLNARERLTREQAPGTGRHDSICANISQFAVPPTTRFPLTAESQE